jgi:putative transposase
MTSETSMTLMEYLSQVGVDPNGDFLREGARLLAQMAMELEVSQQIGAGKYERTPERKTQRNGYRDRDWDTRVGTLALQIPKLRQGSYFPSLLEPRRQTERALLSVVQQAYISGVSTRKVDALVQALGLDGIDKSLVSRTCQQLDALVGEFRNRPLEHSYPYIWLDAVYLKVRQNHRIVSQAAVVAIGVRETGEREVLGLALGAGESEPFWVEFLRSLVARGLKGVQLVTSDSHEGLKAAINKVLTGTTWQRCRVHFMRNLLAHIPNGEKTMVAAVLRTIFVQPNRQAAGQQVAETLRLMRERWPQAAAVLAEAEDDVLAYMSFPVEHWSRIYSTNPLERLNREIRRRTDVVGVFPNADAALRLVGAVLIEQTDEWEVDKRYFSQESMRRVLAPQAEALPPKEGHLPRLAPVH